MANYFVINSKFRPYSFDELIKPYQMYAQEYDKQEALLDAAREKEFSAGLLDAEQDRAAYDMYIAANQGLQEVSDELATRGLSARLRGRLKTTARDYKRTMDTLNTAQEALNAERDRRAKMGPDYVYQQNNLRIGDFLNGATPNQRSASLKTVAENVGKQFAAHAGTISADTWSKVLDMNGKYTGYFDVTTESGLTGAQLAAIQTDDATWNAMLNSDSISNEEKQQLQRFRNIISAEKAAVGFDEYDTPEQMELQNAINIGASAGLGSTTHNYKQDEAYNPLGWSNYNLSLARYNDTKQLQRLQLEAKYPMYQFDDKGNFVKNEDGSLKINEGWTEKNGRWTGPNGQEVESVSSPEKKAPYVGIQWWGRSGEHMSWDSNKDFNTARKVGTGVTNVSELTEKNIQRLAIALGVDTNMSDPDIFNLAVRRGVSISVINHGYKDKDKTQPNDDQELIISAFKPVDKVGGVPVSAEQEDSYDPDRV